MMMRTVGRAEQARITSSTLLLLCWLSFTVLLLLLSSNAHHHAVTGAPILHLKSFSSRKLVLNEARPLPNLEDDDSVVSSSPHPTLPNLKQQLTLSLSEMKTRASVMHDDDAINDLSSRITHDHSSSAFFAPRAFIVSFVPGTVFNEQLLSEFKSVTKGVELIDYLPQYSFVVHATSYQMSLVAHWDQVEQIAEYGPELKLCPTVAYSGNSDKSSKHSRSDKNNGEEEEPLMATMAQWLEASIEGNLQKAQLFKERYQRKKRQMEQQKTTTTTEQPTPVNNDDHHASSDENTVREETEDEAAQTNTLDTLVVKLFKSVSSDVEKYKSHLLEHNIRFETLAQTSKATIILKVSSDQSMDAAKLLSQYPEIQWIEKDLETEMTPDMKHVSWVVQSAQKARQPFTEAGLTGKGQVIGVSDTGLDVNNCYFYDANHNVPFYDDFNAAIPHKTSSHRSVEMYFTFLDNVDEVDGHGTHVCGIASGSYVSTVDSNRTLLTQYNGVAPDSKIAFVDVGCQNRDGCNCTTNTPEGVCPCSPTCAYGKLNLPTDVRVGYFSKPYEAGARIHSSSLGGTIGMTYNDKSVAVDEFTYEHDDFLVVWSAGNSGGEGGYMTLTGSFKQAKNHIVVGASTSPVDSWRDRYGIYEDYSKLLSTSQNQLVELLGCGCNPYTVDLCNEVAAMRNDCCDFLQDCTLSIPQLQSKIFPQQSLDCCKKCNLKILTSYKSRYDFQSIAGLSSLGPAMDGRLKPDVVAPGYYINSAKSYGSDQTKACPVALSDDPKHHLLFKAGTRYGSISCDL